MPTNEKNSRGIITRGFGKSLWTFAILAAMILAFASSCNGMFEPDVLAPGGVVAEVSGDSVADLGILISWEAVENAGGYVVSRSEDGGAFTVIGSTSAGQLSFLDKDDDLVLGASYQYRVQAYGLWHVALGSASAASAATDYFLAPLWTALVGDQGLEEASDATAVKIVAAPGGTVYYAYADSSGTFHAGRIVEKEDPDDEDAVIYEVQSYDAFAALAHNAGAPDFDLLYSGGYVYFAYADGDAGLGTPGAVTVLRIQATEDDDAEDDDVQWESVLLGSRGFTQSEAVSVSLAVSAGFGGSGTLYAGYVDRGASPAVPKVLSYNLGSGPISVWSVVGSSGALELVDDAYSVHLLADGGSLLATYTTDAGVRLKGIASASQVWSPYDPPPLGLPVGDVSIALMAPQGLLTIASYATGTSIWAIKEYSEDSGAWDADLAASSGFADVATAADLENPFSVALSGGDDLVLLASSSEGPSVVFFDRDSGKWFSYGNPGGPTSDGPVDSAHLVASGSSYYAAWVEDGHVRITLGE